MSPEWSTACDQALEKLRVATVQQEEAAARAAAGQSGGWSDVLLGPLPGLIWAQTPGPAAGAAALASNAHSARSLLTVLEEKRWRITTDDEAREFVATCGRFSDVSDILATANSLSFAGGMSEIAQETAEDVGDLAKGVAFGIGGLGLLALAVVVFVLVERR